MRKMTVHIYQWSLKSLLEQCYSRVATVSDDAICICVPPVRGDESGLRSRRPFQWREMGVTLGEKDGLLHPVHAPSPGQLDFDSPVLFMVSFRHCPWIHGAVKQKQALFKDGNTKVKKTARCHIVRGRAVCPPWGISKDSKPGSQDGPCLGQLSTCAQCVQLISAGGHCLAL